MENGRIGHFSSNCTPKAPVSFQTNFSVLLGNGDGTFQSARSWTCPPARHFWRF